MFLEAVLTVAVFGVAVLGEAMLNVGVLGVAVLGVAVLTVGVLGVAESPMDSVSSCIGLLSAPSGAWRCSIISLCCRIYASELFSRNMAHGVRKPSCVITKQTT